MFPGMTSCFVGLECHSLHTKRACAKFIGEDRLSLLSRNLSILQSIFSSMKPLNKDAIILVVSNPVDILTHFARQLSGLPPTQVFGSGTSLDSARLRGRLAQELEVSPNSVNAYVLGEHGESQFVSPISSL